MQLVQQPHHRFTILAVQVAGRFVRQQDARRPRQRTRHSHPLLLSTAQLCRVVPQPVRHVHALQRLHHAVLALARRHPAPVRQRQLDILKHRQVADKVEALKNKPDLLVAYPRPVRKVQVRHRLAVQRVRPAPSACPAIPGWTAASTCRNRKARSSPHTRRVRSTGALHSTARASRSRPCRKTFVRPSMWISLSVSLCHPAPSLPKRQVAQHQCRKTCLQFVCTHNCHLQRARTRYQLHLSYCSTRMMIRVVPLTHV